MKNLFIILTALAVLVSCSRDSGSGNASDGDVYAVSYIQELSATNYEEAMRLTEEGLRKGRISIFYANILRARMTYMHTEDYNAAAAYMHKALEQEEAKDPAVRTDLLYHLATILKSGKNYTGLLETCTEGKEYANISGDAFYENAFDFMAGNCLFDMGEDESGLEMMRDAISKVSLIAKNEQEYGHLIFFEGQLINSLVEIEEYGECLKECVLYENLVSRMEKKFPGADPEYFDRDRFYNDVNLAVCQAGLGDMPSAEKFFARACSRGYAKTSGGKIRMARYYSVTGDTERLVRLYTEEIPFRGDTVSRLYIQQLARLRTAYEKAGMVSKAREYELRYNDLSERIIEKEQSEGTLVNAARFDAQRYRLLLYGTMASIRRNRGLILAIVVLFLVAVALLLLKINNVFAKKIKRYREDADSLRKDLSSIQRQVSVIAVKGLADKKESGSPLQELIERNGLYLDKTLNRETAAGKLGVSQSEISNMLAGIQPGLKFPDYIKGLRIQHALELIGENPDIPVAELSERCGFYTVRSLQRAFLAITGMSPREYAKRLKQRNQAI